MMRKYIILFLSLPDIAFGKLMLFSGDKYLGCLDCSSVAADSICNPFGDYENEFSSDSIWNMFGQYGNEFMESVFK